MNMHDRSNDARDHEAARGVERWLDDALAEYAKVEPRTGLEGRVLARLAAEQERSSRSLWWGAFALSTAAALALVLFWLGSVDRKFIPQVPVAKVAVGPKAGPTRGTGTSAGTKAVEDGRPRPPRQKANVQPKALPRLEQFPSPTPLTDQEKMLALYVREFPARAALMARAQTDLHKQDELEMATPWPAKATGTLEQQE